MELIGTVVVYIIMTCALVGCIASVVRPESELGQQLVAGIDSIGPIFLPVAGIMAAAPYLTAFVSTVFGPAYGLLGADPANVLAALAMIKDLKAKDKVIVMAFAVCCAFLFGDHLSFTANFQPSLIVPVLVGKLVAGVCAIAFAFLLAVKKAESLELEDKAEEARALEGKQGEVAVDYFTDV